MHTALSNAAFDDNLGATNASWGVRDIEVVAAAGRAYDLHLAERVMMPANNLSLNFCRGRRGSAVDREAAP